MPDESLATLYRAYIACLNTRELSRLGEFVADHVEHNERAIGPVKGVRFIFETTNEPTIFCAVRLPGSSLQEEGVRFICCGGLGQVHLPAQL